MYKPPARHDRGEIEAKAAETKKNGRRNKTAVVRRPIFANGGSVLPSLLVCERLESEETVSASKPLIGRLPGPISAGAINDPRGERSRER